VLLVVIERDIPRHLRHREYKARFLYSHDESKKICQKKKYTKENKNKRERERERENIYY